MARRSVGEAPTLELVLKRNAVERLKREKSPLGILGELPALIATGYADIPEEDIVRMKWWGLYHDKPKVGASPALAQRLRDEIAEMVGQRHAELADELRALRPCVTKRDPTYEARRDFFQALVAERVA